MNIVMTFNDPIIIYFYKHIKDIVGVDQSEL